MSDENNESDLDFDFNTSEVKEEKDIGGSSLVPEGKHLAVVESIEKDHGATPCYKFQFSITAGPSKGRKVFERLFLSEKANGRVILFGSRLGLIASSELGKPSVRKSWKEAVGKTVVIEVAHRKYDKDGQQKTAVNLSYNGIFKTDDPAVADIVAAAAPAASATPAAGAQVEFDDL